MPADPDKPGDEGSGFRSSMKTASPYLGLGMQIALSMALFVVGGYLLDEWLGTTPWLTIVGAILGMIAIFTLIIRLSKTLNRHDRDRGKQPKH